MVPAGSYANRNCCAGSVRDAGKADPLHLEIAADAQTSGGLLLAVPAAEAPESVADLRAAGVSDAAIIGEVFERKEGVIARW
jgi:selenide,water dikinase